MMGSSQRAAKVRLAKHVKPVLAVALVVVIGMILVYFVVHLRRRPGLSAEKKELAQQKIEIQEKVDFFDFKGKVKVKAARRFLGEDNLYHLVGPVEIIDQGKKGGGEISIAGDSVIYDKDWKHFVMQGKVKVRAEDVLLEAENIDYDRENEIFRTENGVLFSSSRFSGSARRVVYEMKENAVSFEDNVEFKLIPRLQNPEPLLVKSARLVYSLRNRKGRIEGGPDQSPVSFSHGRSQGTAGLIEFEQFYNDDDLKVLFLKGRVKVSLDESSSAPAQETAGKTGEKAVPGQPQEERGWNFLQSERQDIEADEIKIRSFLNLPELHAVESKGRCSFKFMAASGEQTLVQGEAVDFIFNRGAKLREFRVIGKARITKDLKDGQPDRLLEGETMILDGETEVLRIQGKNGEPARLVSEKNEVTADEVQVSIRNDSFGAKGRTKAILRPPMEAAKPTGFFAKDKPVFANAQSMRYSAAEKRFLMNGQVKMWQDKEVLVGQDISLQEETGEVQGIGDVRSIFPHTPKEGQKEERVEISAGRMSYDPKSNQIVYEDHCSLKTKNIELSAGLVTVTPGEAAGQIRWMRATKNVKIVQESREAVGETAEYDVQQDTMALTGRPVLTLKDKATVRGDKLTFRLGDGTILVESQDQQRSVAVIKS